MFGQSIKDLVADDQPVPKGLIYLCRHLEDETVKLGAKAAEADLRLLLNNTNATTEILNDLKTALNQEDYTIPLSAATAFRLLKLFLRELPSSLVPESMFDRILELCETEINSTCEMFQACPDLKTYASFMLRDERLEASLHTWLASKTAVLASDFESQSWLVSAEKTARRQLQTAIIACCAHPSRRPEALEELFFELPPVNRRAIEFLATTLCRIDLAYPKHTHALHYFAQELGKHIVRPFIFKSGASTYSKATQHHLQSVSFLLILNMIRRKHNLVSAKLRQQANLSADKLVSVMLTNMMQVKSAPSAMTMMARRDSISSHQSTRSHHANSITSITAKSGPTAPATTLRNATQTINGHAIDTVYHRDGVMEVIASKPHGTSNTTVQMTKELLCSPQATASIAQQCPNLVTWLRQPHTMQSDKPPLNLYSLLPLPPLDDPISPAPDADKATPAPGANTIHLLGQAFEHQDAKTPVLDVSMLVSETTRDNLLQSPGLTAVNFNYAHALFPRTVDQGLNRTKEPLEQLPSTMMAAVGAATLKLPYEHDKHDDLLNHELPKKELRKWTRCPQCDKVVARDRKLVICRYCDRSLCNSCCARHFVVPSYIIHKANFKPHLLCEQCERHILQHMHLPLLQLDQLSPRALQAFGHTFIEQIKTKARRLQQLIFGKLLVDCPSADVILSLMPSELIFYGAKFSHTTSLRVSLAHLMQLQSQQLLQVMDKYLQLLHRHMQACKACIRAAPACSAGSLCCHIASAPVTTLIHQVDDLDISGISVLDDSGPVVSTSTTLPPTGIDVQEEHDVDVCWSCLQVTHTSCLRLAGDCLKCAADHNPDHELIFNLYDRADVNWF